MLGSQGFVCATRSVSSNRKQLRERRKTRGKRKEKGKSYSEKSRILSGLNIYVTNTPWEWVPMKQVHELYSLRWQIEIVFKTWKSLFDMIIVVLSNKKE